MPDGSRFCGKCGSLLNAVSKCRYCGAEFDMSVNQYCPGCGAKAEIPKTVIGTSQTAVADIIAYVCMFLILCGSVLPFFKIDILSSSQSVNLWSKNFILLTVIGMVLLGADLFWVVKKDAGRGGCTVLIGVLFIADICIQYAYNKSRLTNVEILGSEYDISHLLSPGAGFYLIIFACIGLIIAGCLMPKEEPEENN